MEQAASISSLSAHHAAPLAAFSSCVKQATAGSATYRAVNPVALGEKQRCQRASPGFCSYRLSEGGEREATFLLQSTKLTCKRSPAAKRVIKYQRHHMRSPRAIAGGDMADQGGAIMREVLTREGRGKLDLKDDRAFYSFPRLVTHVDDQFLNNLTELYRRRIPAGGEVLDLMSSWVSHLPPEVNYKRVVGHGMNAAELARNPRLDAFFVKNLNEEPKLEAADCSFDAVLICVSVQYLQQPEKVFAEIYRVLRPGGVCIVSFSNRMFYEKAIASWREGSGYSRVQLVKQYFSCIRGFTQPETVTELPKAETGSGQNSNLLQKFFKLFQRAGSDPFYAVLAYRNFKATE